MYACKRHAYKKKHLHQIVLWHATTAVDCAHELINGESGIKGEAGKIL